VLTADFNRLAIHSGTSVLDVGCGFGRHSFEALRRGANVVALDAGRNEVEGVRDMMGAMLLEGEYGPSQCATALQGDALQLPFADKSFDILLCAEVLEHVPNDQAAMREFARVLRPGATLVVTVPRLGPERINWWLSEEYHRVPGGHIRIYARSVLESRLRDAGFVATGHHYAHALHSPYWWLKCLVGTTNDTHILVRWYHRFLVWDLMKKPRVTRWLESWLNPVLGKSLVLYLRKAQEAP
jgi:SAM-dependent methyltransferase